MKWNTEKKNKNIKIEAYFDTDLGFWEFLRWIETVIKFDEIR